MLFNIVTSYAPQNLKSSRLYKFFIKNTDSAIVFHYKSNWGVPPEHLILCEKEAAINLIFKL
ncbi:hypothetical protein OC25_24095 [Pedobacter kyungheensis]|uniref:Uncharacterized protein n=1 Tax=Pedobacter kyungheensis TaxID=1069985 RepID=A0A0C1D1U8_9SPHI|nr:hypothetical protein OC25_24095 [Pedobacter kyungheensis]